MSAICVICSEELIVIGLNTDATPCGHVFHRSCIINFIAGHNYCPYCRKSCTLKQLVRLRWHMTEKPQLDYYDEMTIFNQLMLEKVAELTDDMNEKDEYLDYLENTLQCIMEKFGTIRLETRQLKRKNDELKIRIKKLLKKRESRKLSQDSIIEQLNQKLTVLSLLVGEEVQET
ncbi:unnamed protein product [Diamesa tonsa]